jgi:Core-2/I-Branching enzyme
MQLGCCRQYTCYSDEHYIPSLLAYHGLESETDCWGGVMYADWQTGSAHPVQYEPEHVDANLIKVARNIDHCHSNAAIR